MTFSRPGWPTEAVVARSSREGRRPSRRHAPVGYQRFEAGQVLHVPACGGRAVASDHARAARMRPSGRIWRHHPLRSRQLRTRPTQGPPSRPPPLPWRLPQAIAPGRASRVTPGFPRVGEALGVPPSRETTCTTPARAPRLVGDEDEAAAVRRPFEEATAAGDGELEASGAVAAAAPEREARRVEPGDPLAVRRELHEPPARLRPARSASARRRSAGVPCGGAPAATILRPSG